jgi:hypothetical protein
MRKHLALFSLMLLGTIGMKSAGLIYVPDGSIISEPTPVEQFMDSIAAIETPGGGYHTVNKYGMMGRYQFSLETIKAVGIRVTRQQFLRNRELQDTAMVRLMEMNEQELSGYIERYDGRTVKGVKVTRASILAGAHFAGANGVKQFLTNDDRTGTVDGFGTSLRKYMSYFSNFHLPPMRG